MILCKGFIAESWPEGSSEGADTRWSSPLDADAVFDTVLNRANATIMKKKASFYKEKADEVSKVFEKYEHVISVFGGDPDVNVSESCNKLKHLLMTTYVEVLFFTALCIPDCKKRDLKRNIHALDAQMASSGDPSLVHPAFEAVLVSARSMTCTPAEA